MEVMPHGGIPSHTEQHVQWMDSSVHIHTYVGVYTHKYVHVEYCTYNI